MNIMIIDSEYLITNIHFILSIPSIYASINAVIFTDKTKKKYINNFSIHYGVCICDAF